MRKIFVSFYHLFIVPFKTITKLLGLVSASVFVLCVLFYGMTIEFILNQDILQADINDVLTIQMEDRSGQPDEARILFSVTNGSNDFFKLETWEHASLPPDAYQNSPRAKFDKVCLVLKRLEHMAKTEKKPVQEGQYIHP